MVTDRDVFFMRKALQLAERGRGRTSPNPMVGALLVDPDGVIVGRGSHEFAGGPHAEIHALADAGARARGATLYCTLEPCSHQGRTGPCAPRVIEAGIVRAVIATEDPNPAVSGAGNAQLRAAGVRVSSGVLEREARRLNRAFFSLMTRQRPVVTMKAAVSLDGAIAGPGGVPVRLTGPAADRHVHRERAEIDAIAIGSGTVLADDPRLTPRVAYRARPLTRIVFDRRLRTPPTAALLRTLEAGPVIIVCSTTEAGRHGAARQALEREGATLLVMPDGAPLADVLTELGRRGIGSVIVEGGAGLHAAFWDAGLVDRVLLYIAPRALGADATYWLGGPIITAARIADRCAWPLGEDVLIEAHVHGID